MVASQNGWRANDRSVISSINVPGGKLAVRTGHIGTIFSHLVNRFHYEVEPLAWPGNWGYAERPIRGGVELSNHASGTAIDLNAPMHPLGKEHTFSAVRTAKIREIVRFYEGVIRWGGDYVGRKDEMHFEINDGVTEAQVAKIAAKCAGAPAAPAPPAPINMIVGAIKECYERTKGAVGPPLGSEVPTLDGKGRWQEFASGAIYWHPDVDNGVAHEVRGVILQRWRDIGSELTTGYPISDELEHGRGRSSHFNDGWAIYWTPETGAWEVRGGFRNVYAAQGWESGPLGYPTSAEYNNNGLTAQNFEGGMLLVFDGKVFRSV